MEYILKHKNIDVASFVIENNEITEVSSIIKKEHLPLGLTYTKNDKLTPGSLNKWWEKRSIPINRQDLDKALATLNINAPAELLVKNLSLSLSDHYWICPSDIKLDWHKVNFFENNFSPDVGNALFGEKISKLKNYVSPDSTSDGWLKKRWVIQNGERYLIKVGSGSEYQEPYNEVLASEIMERLGIPHVEYKIIELYDKPYCICKNFLSADTELVSANRIYNSLKLTNEESKYKHYISAAKQTGLKNTNKFIDQMLIVDFITANTDRHLSNFGAIRNADTLEWIGYAPIFDTGTSMFHKTGRHDIQNSEPESQPFKNYHKEQIKLVKDFSPYNFNNLKDIDKYFHSLLKKNTEINDSKKELICSTLTGRINQIKRISVSQTKHRSDSYGYSR